MFKLPTDEEVYKDKVKELSEKVLLAFISSGRVDTGGDYDITCKQSIRMAKKFLKEIEEE